MDVAGFSANGAYFGGFVMGQIQNVDFMGIVIGPHGDVDGSCSLRCDNIASIGRKFRVGLCRLHGLDHTIFAEERDPDTAGAGVTVFAGLPKGGGIDPVAGLNGNRHGIHRSRFMDPPAGACVIIVRVMFQYRPQIDAAAQVFRQFTQMVRIDRTGFRLYHPDFSLGGSLGFQDAFGFTAVRQKIIPLPAQTFTQGVCDRLCIPQWVDHGHHQCSAACRCGCRDLFCGGITVPGHKSHRSIHLWCFQEAHIDERCPHGFPSHLIIADLVIVDGVMDSRRRGGGVPAFPLLHLSRVVHGAVFIVGQEVIRHTVRPIGHIDPFFTDVAYQPDIRQIRVVAHPVLGHPGAGHLQILKGFVVAARGGIGVDAGTVTVAPVAACPDRNDSAVFEGLLGCIPIGIMVKGQLRFEAFVHGQVFGYIVFRSHRVVVAALAPEVGHMAQGKVACGDFLAQCLGASAEHGLALFILGRSRLPDIDGGSAMGGIDDPYLFSRLLYPFVGKAAVGAFSARAFIGEHINRIVTKTVRPSHGVDFPVLPGQCAGRIVGGVGDIHVIPVTIGGVDHAIGTNNGLVGITLVALHIALSDQQQQGNGRGGHSDRVKLTVDAHLCRANTGGYHGVSHQSHHSRIQNRVFFHIVAHLIRSRLPFVDDLYRFASNIIMIVVTKVQFLTFPKGLRSLFHQIRRIRKTDIGCSRGSSKLEGDLAVPIRIVSTNGIAVFIQEPHPVGSFGIIGGVGLHRNHGIGPISNLVFLNHRSRAVGGQSIAVPILALGQQRIGAGVGCSRKGSPGRQINAVFILIGHSDLLCGNRREIEIQLRRSLLPLHIAEDRVGAAHLNIQGCAAAAIKSHRQLTGCKVRTVCHLHRRFHNTGVNRVASGSIGFLQIDLDIPGDTAVKADDFCGIVDSNFVDDFAIAQDHRLGISGFQDIHDSLGGADTIVVLIAVSGHQCIICFGSDYRFHRRYRINKLITAQPVIGKVSKELLHTPPEPPHSGHYRLRYLNVCHISICIVQNARTNCGVITGIHDDVTQFDLVFSIFPRHSNGVHARDIGNIICIVGAGNIQHILGKFGADCAKVSCLFRVTFHKQILRIQHGFFVFQSCQERFQAHIQSHISIRIDHTGVRNTLVGHSCQERIIMICTFCIHQSRHICQGCPFHIG